MRAHLGEGREDCALGNAIQGVDFWRCFDLVDAVLVEQVLNGVRQELAGPARQQGAHLGDAALAMRGQGVEARDEASDVCAGLVARAQCNTHLVPGRRREPSHI